MTTIGVKVPDGFEEYLEEKDDYLIALARLSKKEKRYNSEEVEKELGLKY